MSTHIEQEIEEIRVEIKARVGQHRAISKALGVHYNWVRRFASGELKEPGAVKYAHLKAWIETHSKGS